MNLSHDPVATQESLYSLPYHWFPEPWLKQFERSEKLRIMGAMIRAHRMGAITPYLDVGCGDGRWTHDLSHWIPSQLGETIHSHGIDFSARAIAFAKLISPDIDFQVSPGEDIPFPEKMFGLVSAIEVIEHVPDVSELKFLLELKRVTRDDGLIILTTPSWNLRLAEHHFRHYSIKQFRSLAHKAGLQILEIRGQSIPYYNPSLTLVSANWCG